METIEISKGMKLHFIETTKFKTTAISILIRRPLNREEVTKNALIPNVLQRGSSKYPDMVKINSFLENLYGTIFEAQVIKKGEQQIIQLFAEFINLKEKSNTEKILEFLKEMMLNPLMEDDGFKKEYVEAEKDNLEIVIKCRINNKGEYAKLRCIEEMCKHSDGQKDESFGIYGDGFIEDLEEINHQNLYEHYEKVLKQAAIDFIVIGNEDVCELAKLIKDNFAMERENIEDIPLPELNYNPSKETTIEENIEITQGKICLGIRSGVDPNSEDFYKLMVLNEIFGGGATSKLFSVIREKESLCYYVNSFVYRFKTIILVQSGVDSDNFQRVINLVKEQLDKIKQGDISSEELENAKKSLVKKFLSIEDYQGQAMDFYVSQHMLGDRDGICDVMEKISAVTREDLPEIAEKLYIDTVYLLK